MLLLFTKQSRITSRWKNSVRKKIRHSNPWANSAFWSRRYFIVQFPQKTRTGFSIQLTSPQILIGYASKRGERLDGRLTRGRCRRIERQHRIIILRQKIQRKRRVIQKKEENNSHFHVLTAQSNQQKMVRRVIPPSRSILFDYG